MKECARCQQPAFTKITPETSYCKSCYSEYIEKKVRTAINKYKMMHYGCHVAVGVSGGKDSVTLLHILKKVVKKDTKMTAVIVDEGVEGYRPHGIEIAIKNAEKLDIPYKIISYKGEYGHSLDEMVVEKPFEKTSCGVCGVFRRKALNKAAVELNADYLATGHNMDDEAESILMNALRGDPVRFTRQSRKPEKRVEGLIPRIKPLVMVTQPEIIFYAVANNIEYHDGVCPYAGEARRNAIREFLYDQERKHYGTMKNIILFQDELLEQIGKEKKEEEENITKCKKCGEQTDRKEGKCQGCKMREEIERKKKERQEGKGKKEEREKEKEDKEEEEE